MNIARATFCLSFSLLLLTPKLSANDDIKDTMFNPIHTGVTSLGIAPDARGGSMGDLGVATDPDANSQYWNPSKYPFAYSDAGLSFSYTPWLRKLVSDINLAYLAGYWKIGNSGRQALSGSLRYFSLGEIHINNEAGQQIDRINPFEMAVDLGYSAKLSEKFSMGVTFRYIHSDLAYDKEQDYGAGSAFAADISAYYTTYPMIGNSECQWSWGINASNIGSKVSYDGGATSVFLPANLRIGTTLAFPIDNYNILSLSVDANKLLVPGQPQRMQYEDDLAHEEALEEYYATSSIGGIFKSFSDAPGGFKEEMQEINLSVGAEYNYNHQFFLRAGYFHEHKLKGNRKYATLGAGFALHVFRLDAAYVISVAQQSPLDQTLRFSLSFDMGGLKELVGNGRPRK